MRKFFRWFLVFFFLGLAGFFYVRYYWVFGTGTKAGTLNTFMKKGYIFKTYEGKIIQSGFRTNVQSIDFNFSVTDERVAQILLNSAGKEVELRYREHFGALPWRGFEKYIVDSVYNVRDPNLDRGSIQPR